MGKLKYRLKKWGMRMSYACGVLTIALPARAFAAVAGGGVLPWDQPLNTLQTDLQGPVAHAVTTAAIIGTGITWAVSEHGPACARCRRWPLAARLPWERPRS